MSVQSDVAAALALSDDLVDILSGGIYSQDVVGEISRQATPDAFDSNGELLPCALVAEGTETPRGGIDHPGQGIAVQTPVNLYFYQRSGYEDIDAAMELSFHLLNGQKIGSNTWRVEYDNTVKNQVDQALDCPLGVQRFVVVRRRLPSTPGGSS